MWIREDDFVWKCYNIGKSFWPFLILSFIIHVVILLLI